MNVSEIDTEIQRLREYEETIVGTKCEVYQRIVGYYRNVKNWNPGKKEEYQDRKIFTPTINEERIKNRPEKKEVLHEVRPISPNCPWA